MTKDHFSQWWVASKPYSSSNLTSVNVYHSFITKPIILGQERILDPAQAGTENLHFNTVTEGNRSVTSLSSEGSNGVISMN